MLSEQAKHPVTMLASPPLSSWPVQCSLVTGLATLSYLSSCWADFVFDDNEAILTNQDITMETPLLDVFTHDFWGRSVLDKNSHKSYRPLTVLTFRVNHWLGGLDPFGYHVTNLVLHVIVCLLYLRVCVCLLSDSTHSPCDPTPQNKSRAFHESDWWVGLLAALLFASHPVHTETVSWSVCLCMHSKCLAIYV